MTNTVQFRKLNPNESKLYRELRLACLKEYPSYFGSIYEVEVELPKLAYEKYIEASDPDHFVIGAFVDHALVGICGFRRNQHSRCRHRAEIIQMFVQSKYQGLKIGKNLLKTTIDEAFKIEGIEQIELGAVKSNTSAIRLYEKAGFVEYSRIKNYYKDPGRYEDVHF